MRLDLRAEWKSGIGTTSRVPPRGGRGSRMRICDDCGLLQSLPAPMPEMDCRCPRCDALLRRDWQSTAAVPMALGVTSLLFGAVILSTPFLTIQVIGQGQGFTVRSGASAFLSGGWWMLSLLVIAAVILVPLLRVSLLLVVLGGLTMKQSPSWLFRPLRWHECLRPWSMLEVILLGALIAYTHLVSLADIALTPAIFALGGLVVALIATDLSFEPQTAWDALEARGTTAAMVPSAPPSATVERPLLACRCCRRVVAARPGQVCARCGTALRRRKPGGGGRTWGLIAAATAFYIAANAFPVMTVLTHGGTVPLTILGSVAAFASSGLLPLALIVFLTAVAVPLLKLAGLVLMLRTSGGPAPVLRRRTGFYRLIDRAGRWSIVNILAVACIGAFIRFGLLAPVTVGDGAALFGAGVVLTTLAARSFDPRRMWDAADVSDPKSSH